MKDSAGAQQWSSRPWNTDAGRLVWWLKQHRRSGSYTSRRGVYMAWVMALQGIGELASRQAVKAAGLELPAWLVPAPQPEAGSIKLLPARVSENVTRAA